MDLYAEHILEHFKNPRCTSPLKDRTVEHAEENLACGDTLSLALLIEGKKITGVEWHGSGCAISQAGMSLLTEQLAGKNAAAVAKLSPKDQRAFLGVPISTRRLKCALLPLFTLRNALRKWQGEPPLTWPELLDED
ncbi:MAG TPA: Fe-S cluster protein [Candidatus Peribacter riflensis]|uniref:Nitrogen fixation protein NifU-related protein n=1 Tax=Candidatus Peribacter riflensis TaxID=1735162 RepID=A0A0S1SM26_9BACT|nr:MAG: nitrogen fixation protein NifU-related protein [Candidatus Peribacter riflensis]OGJ79204.1 MAG: hypothetical protein A2398_03460 [Candidatus Peribacteria bacterium RIFOXYB1_FULL_57_12]OGJ82616.1 MAG: hypothetical protein A2412_04315 [Candidatus Peribacteria bacterium RIFOXYC1_FULL_58_8]ALM11367.1 MAG: NifU family SUF system FeS assembly protein [Candidatus Peribacter riflensis]ALM12469.1 MAG: nitrogen fixation protein NifU-related protein [Candidatus Peribacter riflensis]